MNAFKNLLLFNEEEEEEEKEENEENEEKDEIGRDVWILKFLSIRLHFTSGGNGTLCRH